MAIAELKLDGYVQHSQTLHLYNHSDKTHASIKIAKVIFKMVYQHAKWAINDYNKCHLKFGNGKCITKQ